MFKKLNTRIGQSTSEYAILVGIVVAAVIAMQLYMKRSVQAHIKDAYDFVGQVNYTSELSGDKTFENLFSTIQYEPSSVKSSLRTIESGSRRVNLLNDGGVTTGITSGVTQRSGNVTIANST